MLSEEELEVLRLFAYACGDADLDWQGTTVDPPDAVSRDGTVGLELTRLAPGGAGQGGSPTTRRQTLRDRVLSGAQRVLEGDPGRGFRVHAIWDDEPELSPSDVGALSQALAEAARCLRGEAMRLAADEVAGEVVRYRGDLTDPLRGKIACLSISWTPGTVTWDFAGSGQSIVLTGGRPVQDIIDRKGAGISRWSVDVRERWLVIHLDPSTFTEDLHLIAGPYRSKFDRVFLVDAVELTCREVGTTRD